MMMESVDESEQGRPAGRATAWTSAYSMSLTKSMKAMMAGSRLQRQSLDFHRAVAGDVEEEAFTQLLDAVSKKDKEEMMDIIINCPTVVEERRTKDDRVPLHLVCELVPNYVFADVIELIIRHSPESVAMMDVHGQTPLHVLAKNTTVTTQSISALVEAFPSAPVMCDKMSNSPFHYLAQNDSCELEMVRVMCSPDTCSLRNNEHRVPLHYLALTKTFRRATFLYTLQCYPEAASVVDKHGATLLHYVSRNAGVDCALFETVLRANPKSAMGKDELGQLPLHLLCENPSITSDMLRGLLDAYPNAIGQTLDNDLTALHQLCANEAVTEGMLSEYCLYDENNEATRMLDAHGCTPLHILCMNAKVTASHLRSLLLAMHDTMFASDVHGRTPLHYICMNKAVAPELLWLLFEQGQEMARTTDEDGRLPLHHICANRGVTPAVVEIMFDAFPAASVTQDQGLKLPIQYLVDNSAAVPETTSLLISGPSSYRMRYDFIGVGGSCKTISRGSEISFIQTNFALDTRTSEKVIMKFYSSLSAFEHERDVVRRLVSAESLRNDDSPATLFVVDEFEDAKRRVAASVHTLAPEDQIGDSWVTLSHGLVVNAPRYTFDSWMKESRPRGTDLNDSIARLVDVVAFWHKSAHLVHGNICPENIGRFEGEEIGLINFCTSRAAEQSHFLGNTMICAHYCAPEAATAFHVHDQFQPTMDSDIWQLGCTIFALVHGCALIEKLVPWHSHIGRDQLFHVVRALTDDVLVNMIDSVASPYQSLLKSILVINPTQRPTIEKVQKGIIRATADINADEDTSNATNYDITQRAIDELPLVLAPSPPKHEHLQFMKKEQAHLRSELLAAMKNARLMAEKYNLACTEIGELKNRLDQLLQQKKAVQLEAQVFARNHQTMTNQLHTATQLLLNLVPLATQVYGPDADEYLSDALSQAAGADPIPAVRLHHRPTTGAVQMLKRQLQNSVLAYGCVQTWARGNTNTSALDDDNYDDMDEPYPTSDEQSKISPTSSSEQSPTNDGHVDFTGASYTSIPI